MIELNRNGYLFVTRHSAKADEFKRLGNQLARNGGGALRVHDADLRNYRPSSTKLELDLDGADLLLGIDNITRAFPSLRDSNAVAALHVRRCGSMNPFKLVRPAQPCLCCSLCLVLGDLLPLTRWTAIADDRIGQLRAHESARVLSARADPARSRHRRLGRWRTHQRPPSRSARRRVARRRDAKRCVCDRPALGRDARDAHAARALEV